MTLYPEVMKKAQAEIDAVVGNNRLPTFADREYLPYIDAITKEVFRWNSVIPTCECSSLPEAQLSDIESSQAYPIGQHRTIFMPAILSPRDRLSLPISG